MYNQQYIIQVVMLTLEGREMESSQKGSNVTEECPHVSQERVLRRRPTNTSTSREFSSSLYHLHHLSGLEGGGGGGGGGL